MRGPIGSTMASNDVGGKLLNGFKSVYINSLVYVKVKGAETKYFRIDSGVRKVSIMFPWLFNVYMDTVMKELKMGMGRRGVRFQEEGREWRLPGFFVCRGLGFVW